MAIVDRHINTLVLKERGSYTEAYSDQDTVAERNNSPSFMNGQGSAIEEDSAYSPYVNWAKVWQLGISKGSVTPSARSVLWGDWRKKDLNHICEIHPDVQLISEMTNVGFGFENKFSEDISLKSLENQSDKLFGKSVSSVFKTISSVASTVSAVSYTAAGFQDYGHETKNSAVAKQKVISKYSNAAGWEGVSALNLSNSSLTFTFRFGQAGLYDALEEVFKPVIALAALFQPVESDNSYSFNYMVPNSEYMMGIFMSALISGTADMIKETIQNNIAGENNMFEKIAQKFSTPDNIEQVAKAKNDKAEAESQAEQEKAEAEADKTEKEKKSNILGSADIANVFKEGVKGVLNTAASKAISLNSKVAELKEQSSLALLNSSQMAYFKIGPFNIGPCYVKGVKVEFNSEFTDSQGIPTEGRITLNGIQLVYTATNENLREMLSEDIYRNNTGWEQFDKTGGLPRTRI